MRDETKLFVVLAALLVVVIGAIGAFSYHLLTRPGVNSASQNEIYKSFMDRAAAEEARVAR